MPVLIGGGGVGFSTAPTEVTLPGATAYLIPPGAYFGQLGRYTQSQWLDPATGIWRSTSPGGPGGPRIFNSDGTNHRLINTTGCPVGAIITSAGAAYTSPPTVAVSSGGSVWRVILGGAFSTAVTVTTGGVYNYPPTLVFPAPPAGGVTATATAAISAAAVSSITVVNRGAGYASVPASIALNNTANSPASTFFNPQSSLLQIIQDPRDTGAGGAVLTISSALSTATVPTAVICTDPGSIAQTSLPTLTFTGGGGGSLAATVLMNWTVPNFIVTASVGTVYGNAQPFLVTGAGLFTSVAVVAGDALPDIGVNLAMPRMPVFKGTSTAGGAVSSIGAVIDDAGWGIQRVPDLFVIPGGVGALPTVIAVVTASVGATTDTSFLQLLKL